MGKNANLNGNLLLVANWLKSKAMFSLCHLEILEQGKIIYLHVCAGNFYSNSLRRGSEGTQGALIMLFSLCLPVVKCCGARSVQVLLCSFGPSVERETSLNFESWLLTA